MIIQQSSFCSSCKTIEMFRHHSLLTVDKLPKVEHVFSSKKHLIFRSYDHDTLQTYLTKRMVVKDEKLLHYYKHHIYNNILPYLLRHCPIKQASILSVRPDQAEIIVQGIYVQNMDQDENSDSEWNDEPIEADGNTVYVSKSLVYGKSLREMILNKDDRLDKEFCIDLVGAVVDFIFCHGRIKDLMITSENIIVEDSGFFHLNYFSFVGFEFSKLDKYITRAEFEEILPFLSSSFIKQQDPELRVIDVWMELKFIMLNFYGAFFKRDIVFDSKYLLLDVEVRRTDDKVVQTVERLQRELLPKLFSQQLQKQLKEFDENNKVNYSKLLEEILLKDANKNSENSRRAIGWEQILSCLCRNSQQGQGSSMGNQSKQFENYPIQKNEDLFAHHLLQAIDIYINLGHLVAQQVTGDHQRNTKINKKILNQLKQLDQERTTLIEIKRYSKSLYFPLKFGMKFSTILKYKNWVSMLDSAIETDSTTLDSLRELMEFIIEVREGLISLEPFINSRLIGQALEKRLYHSEQDNHLKSLYSYLQSISDEYRPISHEIDSPIPHHRNLKKEFWRIIFDFLNQLLMTCKKFFLRTTARTIKGGLQINRNDFWTIVAYMDYETPEVTVTDES